MKKKDETQKQIPLSEELIIDEQGRLRVAPKKKQSKPTYSEFFYSPGSVFLACGAIVILMIDLLVFLFANNLKHQFLAHNPEAQYLFYPFVGIILLGMTGSMSLLLFIIYKINAPHLQKTELLLEVLSKEDTDN